MKKICLRMLLMVAFYLFAGEVKSHEHSMLVGDNAGIINTQAGKAKMNEEDNPNSCIPPLINCSNPNIVINALPGQCGAYVSFNLTASGTTPTITYSTPSGSYFTVGTTKVVATAQNACGTSTCTFMVTVQDVELPQIIYTPPNGFVNTNPGVCQGTVPNYVSQMNFNDNCPIASGFVEISGNGATSFGIYTGGTLWAWGRNDYGQLGQFYPPANSTTPMQVGNDKNWVKVAAGYKHVVGVRSNGTLWAWGRNNLGQLGDGTTTDKNVPVQIGTGTNWIQVAAGGFYSLGIKSDGTLWAWGSNNMGQLGDGTTVNKITPVQIGTATDWASVDAGEEHTIALKSDGTMWAWGRNDNGQLGDGSNINKLLPTNIGTTSTWQLVSAGLHQCVAIKTDGTLWSWGWNPYGQLGIGGTSTVYVPTQVGTANNWIHVSTNSYNTTAVKQDGTLWSWGYGSYGQIGNGSNPMLIDSPVQVGFANNWTKTSTGGFYNLAYRSDGKLYAWGFNQYGQLGIGSTTNANIPTQVSVPNSQSITNVVQTPAPGASAPVGISTLIYTVSDASLNYSATSNTLEVIDNQPPTIVCPSNINIPVPSGPNGSVVTFATPAATDNCSFVYYVNQIAGLTSGSVFPVGITPVTYEASDYWNTSQCTFNVIVGTAPTINCPANISVNAAPGQCGANVSFAVTETTAIPASVITYSIAPGSYFTKGTHTVTATATNSIGTSSCTFTVTVIDNQPPTINCPSDITGVVITSTNGAVVNYNAPVGTDNCSGATTSLISGLASGSVFPLGTTAIVYQTVDAAGNSQQCSFNVTVAGAAPSINCPANISVNAVPGQCGANVSFAATETTAIPASVITYSTAPGSFFSVGTHTVNVIATNVAGSSTCSFTVTVIDNEGPVITLPASQVVNALQGTCSSILGDYTSQVSSYDNCNSAALFSKIDAGNQHSLAVKSDWSRWSWGSNFYGQVGNGGTGFSQSTPVMLSTPIAWQSVSAGLDNFSLGIKLDGTLWAWGKNDNGQLGDGTTVAKAGPVQVGNGNNWVQISAGGTHSLGIKSDGTLWAWGNNDYGQLGDGTTISKSTPVQIGAANNWQSVSAGFFHSMAIKSDGTLWVFGKNDYGQLGIGNNANQTSPAQVGSSSDWIKVAAGYYHSLGIRAGGTLWTWGYNSDGQLGDGTTISRNTPVQVGTGSWSDISGGYYHSVGITGSGDLMAWGKNDQSQLGGLSGFPNETTPVEVVVPVPNENWVNVSCGENFSYAIKNNGTLWGWGQNNMGQLGDGSFINRSTPVEIGMLPPALPVVQSPSPGTLIPVGNNVITFSVTDAGGNTTTGSTTITVIDNQLPSISCPSDITGVIATSANGAVVNYSAPVGIDNCTGSTTTLLSGPASGSVFPIGTTAVSYQVEDASGNIAQCTFNVTVIGIPPSIVCPSNITVNSAPGQCGANVSFAATETTGIPASVITYSVAPGSFFSVGTHTVTATATNSLGTSTCSFTVMVTDNELPVITCPANITVNNDPGQCGAVINYNIQYNDNCSGTTLQQTAGLASGQSFPVGTTVNTFVATDAAGNTTTCSFEITVIDVQAPFFTNVPANFSSCNPVTWTAPTPNDNCSGATVSASHQPGATFPSGTTTVTYTVTDASGLTSTASFAVTVLEPSVAAQSIISNRDYNNICSGENITLTLNGGSLGNNAQWVWYSGSCGGTQIASGVTSITVAPATTTTYYARAEGNCNNTACVQLTVQVSTTASLTTPVYSVVPPFGSPGVTDVISVVPVPGATYYRWFTNNGQINSVLFNNQLSPVQTAGPSVNATFVLSQQNYQIRVMAGNACGRSSQANVTIRGTVAAPSSLTGPTSVCPGQSHQYTVSAIPSQSGNIAVTYNWQLIPSNAGTISGSGLTRTITFAPGFNGAQLCVNGISSFGLAGTPLCINITTGAPAPASISGLSSVCEGSSSVSYSATPVANAISYNWTSVPAGVVFSGNTENVTATFPAGPWSGTICVAAVTSTCGTSQPVCMNVSTIAPVTLSGITGAASGVCLESNVNYSTDAGANSYSWTLPSGATGSSSSSSININFGAAFTSGTIEVTGYFACNTSTTTLNVTGAPAMPSIASGGLNTICPGSAAVQYSVTSTGATSFNWSATGVATTSGCANPPLCSDYNVDQWGMTPTLSVTAQNLCGTSDPFVFPVACRFMESGNMLSSVYPNPTKGIVTVEFNSESLSDYSITIADLTGRTILENNGKASLGLNRETIDLTLFGSGIYFMHLKNQEGKSSITKIVVE